MKIPERPDLHRTILLNLKRRYVHYLQHPEHLQTAGGMQFLELLRNEYPKAYDRLIRDLPDDYTVY